MPRPLRIQDSERLYHVMSRGVRKTPIFTDKRDRLRFLQLFAEVVSHREWQCHAYCLMTNHYHFVVRTPNADISAGMQWLNSRFARWFDWRHGFEGHVLERRFNSVFVEGDAHLLELARYIPLNPVRAGLCRHPREWRWSSYRAMVGISERPSFLRTELVLGLLSRDEARAPRLYGDFVAAGIARSGRVLGSDPRNTSRTAYPYP
jgi:putative transposase